MTRLLVVTADDFGLTDGVNRAVVRSHREGIVTSASLLAVGRAYRAAVELAQCTPTLAVGVHLAVVGEDPPLLAPSEVPSLVEGTGHFPRSYHSVLRRGMPVGLTATEFRILVTLMREPGRVLSPRQIVTAVWGPEYANETGYIRRYVTELADLEAPLIHDPPDAERIRRAYSPKLVNHAEAIAHYRTRITAAVSD